MKIRFTSAASIVDAKGKTRRFKAGESYDLPDKEAKRWIARNGAVPEAGKD